MGNAEYMGPLDCSEQYKWQWLKWETLRRGSCETNRTHPSSRFHGRFRTLATLLCPSLQWHASHLDVHSCTLHRFASDVTSDPQAVGFWSGVIVSSLYLGRMLSAPLWGWVVDVYGSRYALQISLLTGGAAMFCCGLTTSLHFICVLRFIAGLFSAVQATCHTMAWQIGGTSGTRMMESAWTLASMLGPGLAGFLLQITTPVSYVPLLEMPPHFLACLVLAMLQVLAALCTPAESSDRAPSDTYGSVGSVRRDGGSNGTRLGAKVAWKLLDTRIFLALVFNALGVFVASAMDEVYVLYGIGYLDISTKMLGSVFLVSGILEFALQTTILHWIVQNSTSGSGLRQLRFWSLMSWGFAILLPPAALSKSMPLHFRMLGLVLAILSRKMGSFLFAVANTAIINIHSSEANVLALAQGWKVSMASLLQCVGPFIGATLYAWSSTTETPPVFGVGFPFVCSAICVFLMACNSLLV